MALALIVASRRSGSGLALRASNAAVALIRPTSDNCDHGSVLCCSLLALFLNATVIPETVTVMATYYFRECVFV